MLKSPLRINKYSNNILNIKILNNNITSDIQEIQSLNINNKNILENFEINNLTHFKNKSNTEKKPAIKSYQDFNKKTKETPKNFVRNNFQISLNTNNLEKYTNKKFHIEKKNLFVSENSQETQNTIIKNLDFNEIYLNKDDLSNFGPVIKTKLASPPSGLRYLKSLNTKTTKGFSIMKNFYNKYLEDDKKFKNIYFDKYFKSEPKEKDLQYFDKKYNSKSIFKTKKNHDYYLKNKLKFVDSQNNQNYNNLNNKKDNIKNKLKSDNNLSFINLKEYYNTINLKKPALSGKLKDQKKLDILYKYDENYKLEIENIKGKKNVDLYQYQKEIVRNLFYL